MIRSSSTIETILSPDATRHSALLARRQCRAGVARWKTPVSDKLERKVICAGHVTGSWRPALPEKLPDNPPGTRRQGSRGSPRRHQSGVPGARATPPSPSLGCAALRGRRRQRHVKTFRAPYEGRAASAAVDGAAPADGQDLGTGAMQLSPACPPQEQLPPPQRGAGSESHPEAAVPVPKAFAYARLLKLRRLAATRRHAEEAEVDHEEDPTDRLRDGQVDEPPGSAAEGPWAEEDRLGSRCPVTEVEGSCGGNKSLFPMQRSHPAQISRPVAIPAASLFCSPPKPSGLLSSGVAPSRSLAPGFSVSRPAVLPSSQGNSRLASPTGRPYLLSSPPPQARSPLGSAHLLPTPPFRSSSISSAEARLAQGPSAPLTIPSLSDPSTSVSRLQRRRSSAAYGSSSSVSPRRKPFLTPPGSSYGSLVGSFEESIISGRMSTVPSKPITFVAQIGVVGIGKCRPSLRCPPHITIEFPAYFYELADDESPTPYVGIIDVDGYGYARGYDYHYGGRQASPSSAGEAAETRRRKWYGYRVPPKGQVQVVVKNPNKTAVKVFLCPYDLTDM
ncbi:MAG: hypothetical protein BJ554DRAFT_1175, partial [Olpidium bornovanus]